ncbi:MAG: DUF3466 family protein [Fimbriimonadaceae bacterium]|nr:DUF3466 family protein [Fimbriimonadaceae bacterium]
MNTKIAASLTVCVVAFSVAQAQTFTITDLGTAPGGTASRIGNSVNDQGKVVGQGLNSPGARAFYYQGGSGTIDIGTLPNGQNAIAFGINNSGQVIGWSTTSPGFDGTTTAFIWDSVNGMQSLGYLPGVINSSFAYGINDSGKVVGSSRAGTSGGHAFVWDSVNGMVDIGALPGGGDSSQAYSINNPGVVVGDSVVGSARIGFIWDGVNGMQSIGTLSAINQASTAYDINDSGKVAGVSKTDANVNHAMIWDGVNGMIDIHSGLVSSEAHSINNQGQVVGFGATGSGNAAFLWDQTNGMRNLNSLLNANSSGWSLTTAYGINNNGQIVGSGVFNGQLRAYIATPDAVPEPATMSVLTLCSLAFLRRKTKSGS